jgi:predicted enzyme related to lactoylglutathione lyase
MAKKAAKRSVAKMKPAAKVAKKAMKKIAKAKRKPAAAKPAAPPAPKAPPGPGVVHWEILAIDQAAQKKFYGALFGWKVDDDNPMSYGVVTAYGEKSIGGGIGTASPGAPASVGFYVGVPSIDATLAQVATLGGQTTMPRTDLGMVIMAQFRDPEGNVIGLVEG